MTTLTVEQAVALVTAFVALVAVLAFAVDRLDDRYLKWINLHGERGEKQ